MTESEWLEPDGLGGFASGTRSGIRSRRYHALLLAARTPPTDRFVLVNGFDAEALTPAGRFALSAQRYTPEVVSPDGFRRIIDFRTDPWPSWRFRLEDGTEITHEVFAVHGSPRVVLRWNLAAGEADSVALAVRPFFSGRDYHALHHENPAFRFEAQVSGDAVRFEPYPGVPAVTALSNARYEPDPCWYRGFLYEHERERGLDFVEDLAAPGIFRFDLGGGPAVMILAVGDIEALSAEIAADNFVATERRRRRRFLTQPGIQLGRRAADAYLVERGRGRTLMAGYPWFTDWGRDTFIALRGLCLATGRFVEARAILLEWAGEVSEGMLPNRFPDHGEAPEYNSVDAALWFVVAVHELWLAAGSLTEADRAQLGAAVEAILEGYDAGTRYGIGLDHDALLAAGTPGTQLTWMDAKVGDWVVTPRIGKPVEVQALWLNALIIGARLANRLGKTSGARWSTLHARGTQAFLEQFWNEEQGCLFDVVDVNHERGHHDGSFRPNQIFAVGGLPFPILEGVRARAVVDVVESRLLTPVGLRSLAPGQPAYAPHYQGNQRERDGAYHQGTVWPWLLGAFVEAWLRVRGDTAEARQQARSKFVAPLRAAADAAGGHLFEIADGDLPHTPRGCPFQAWSLGELLRIEALLDSGPDRK